MVNTRNKGKKPETDSTEVVQSEVIDLSGESDCNSTASSSVRKTTRRSSVGSAASKDEAPLPLRRSRRLSNSSVESVTIDSPIPVATRRSTRGKHATTVTVSDGDDGDSTQGAKKRKVAEQVETLTVIDEEKTEPEIQADIKRPTETNNLKLIKSTSQTNEKESDEKVTSESSPLQEDKEISKECENSLNIKEDIEGEEKEEKENNACEQSKEAVVSKECENNSNMKKNIEGEENEGKENNQCEKLEETVKENNELEKVAVKLDKSKPQKMGQKNVAPKGEPEQSGKQRLPCGAEVMRTIPKGRPKSGRLWKDPKTNPRYMFKDKGLKMPFEKITQLREERKRVKELENRMKEEERLRREDLKRRREINKQRQEENAKKGEIVQVVRNTAKLKRMSKKQLRLIQKRDTTAVN